MTSTKPATTHSSHSSIFFSPYVCTESGARAFGADHPGVDPGPAQAAEKTPVLDLHATVLDDFQTGTLGSRARRGVLHAQLHPEHPGAHGDGLLGDGGNLGALAEAVD